jgi:hypothetical protein
MKINHLSIFVLTFWLIIHVFSFKIDHKVVDILTGWYIMAETNPAHITWSFNSVVQKMCVKSFFYCFFFPTKRHSVDVWLFVVLLQKQAFFWWVFFNEGYSDKLESVCQGVKDMPPQHDWCYILTRYSLNVDMAERTWKKL